MINPTRPLPRGARVSIKEKYLKATVVSFCRWLVKPPGSRKFLAAPLAMFRTMPVSWSQKGHSIADFWKWWKFAVVERVHAAGGHAGEHAHRHAGTQAARQTSSQAGGKAHTHSPAYLQARRLAGTQARRSTRTEMQAGRQACRVGAALHHITSHYIALHHMTLHDFLRRRTTIPDIM